MGIFSLPAETARCSDSLLWFAPPPWSPPRPTPCSLELATLALVLDTLVPPSLPLPSLLPLPSPPLPTPPPLPSASPLPVSTLPTSLCPATLELSLPPLPSPPLPSLPPPLPLPVLLVATPPLEATTARGRLRPSPTLATPVLATLDSDTVTLVSMATASLLPASTPPTSLFLAGDSTKQTSIATSDFCFRSEMRRTLSGVSSYTGKTKK